MGIRGTIFQSPRNKPSKAEGHRGYSKTDGNTQRDRQAEAICE
jgi:hypothetical protein